MIFITTIMFFIYPILTFPIIILGALRDRKYRNIYMIFLAFDIALISLNLDPKKYGLDLNVYFSIMDNIKNISWNTFFEIYVNQKEILTNLLFYVFASIGNYNLWTFFVTFFCYSSLFYIVSDYAGIKKINNKQFILVVGICILFYNNISAITGLRNSLAINIFTLALYFEYFRKKKNIVYKILYLIPCTIHMSMIIGIIIRLIIPFYKGKNKKYILIALIVYAISPTMIINFASKLGNTAMFSDIYEKTNTYIGESRNNILNNMYVLIKTITFANLFIIFEKNYKYNNDKIKDVTELICFFTFLSFNYGVIRDRWFDVCIILLTLTFINSIEKMGKINIINKTILIMSMLFMIIQQYSTLKKIDYADIIKNTYNQTLIQSFRERNN